MRFIITCLAFCLLLYPAFSQDITVSGTVTDENGEVVSGVTVTSSIASTTTDKLGNFQIQVTDTYQSLKIEGEGFEGKEIQLNGQSQITISMSGPNGDTEQVSTGFGTQNKQSSTSSISQIKGGALANQPVVDIEQSSQGRAAGVFIQNNGGKLGEGTKVRIRGGSSLSGSNEPLYVVDGVPLTSNNQSDIDPSLIESMEILKDAAATSLYGSRAANGVVIITTKKGKSGKLKVDLDYQFGVSTLPKRLDLMSPQEYRIMNFEYTIRAIIAGLPQPFASGSLTNLGDFISKENLETWLGDLENLRDEAIADNQNTLSYTFPNNDAMTVNVNHPIFRYQYDTDWQDLAFRTGLSHRTNVNVSGGSDRHKVYLNLNYLNQDGITIGNNYERFGGRINLNSQLSSKLSTNLSFNYTKTDNNRLNEDADIGNPVQMVLLPPGDRPVESNNYILEVRSSEYNPQTEVYNALNFETSDRMNGSLGLVYDFTENLSLNIDGGIDYLNLREERRQGPATQEGNPTGLSRLSTTNLFNYLINGYLDYQKDFDGNSLNVIFGGSYQNSNSTFAFRRARVNSISILEDLDESDPSLLDNPIPGSSFSFISAYSRINYSIDEKYHFQLSARIDGSSKFGLDNRYGVFPAVSGGWILSEESFLQANPTISFLKLRGSYGIIGNTPEDDFLYRTNYFTVNYGNAEGLRLSNLGNRNLKWETTGQLDIGIEFGFFSDRIFGSVNYYHKKTTDLLFPVPVSQVSGFNAVIRNLGSMTNQGLELSLSTVNISSNGFEWTSDFNISTNSNKIQDLGGQSFISGVNAFLEGQPAGAFYMVKYEGVDPISGRSLYRNEFGFTDTDYDDALDNARQIVGNPNPKYYGGLSNNLSYGKIDLSFTFQFVQDIDIYWETGELIANSGFGLFNQTTDQIDRWYQSGDNAPNPRINPALSSTNPSSRWMVDGSYIRLNNINLSYNLTDQLSGLNLTNFTIYIGAQNLFTITNYPGYDPDVSYTDPFSGTFGQNINRGIALFNTPQPRTFITGIKIGF